MLTPLEKVEIDNITTLYTTTEVPMPLQSNYDKIR